MIEENIDGGEESLTVNNPLSTEATSETESTISSPKLEIENMEVHHHPQLQHKPKPWKEYFLEYIMIVLAVFTGFLAESLRENISDKEKEHQYMQSMVEDLKKDTINFAKIIEINTQFDKKIDTLLTYVRFDVPDTLIKYLMKYSFAVTSYYTFDNTKTTLSQLKNAGGFRLIKDTAIVNAIVNYDLKFSDIFDQGSTINKLSVQLASLENELLDYSVYKKLEIEFANKTLEQREAIYNTTKFYLKRDADKIRKLYNDIWYYQAVLKAYYKAMLQPQKQRATQLLQKIQQHYHFEP